MSRRIPALLTLTFLLAACSSMQRSDDAADAKVHMIGMSREDVLTCMGPAKKKASEGTTEVWSYLSTDGQGQSHGTSVTASGITGFGSSHNKSDCTVNIVMKDGVVTRVNYTGNAGSTFAPYDQCGYAIANCVTADRF